jgi:nucleoside-diphosphate-sugar epimerase
VLGGWTTKLPVPSNDKIFLPIRQSNNDDLHNPKANLRVVVTGGGGFLGWKTVKALLRKSPDVEITVLDLFPPHPTRRVHGVRYLVGNLVVDDLSKIFKGAHAVIHTAGVVDLTVDEGITHNVHVVGTARVLAAARAAGVRIFVQTSSVGSVSSPHITGRSQADLPVDFVPPEINPQTGLGFPFFSSYSATKFRSERMALAANSPSEGFRTIAVRLPMIFGLQDPMIVAPLFRGEREIVPEGKGALVEFVYVENAAEMHTECLYSLLEEESSSGLLKRDVRVSGRAFNVTNGDAPREADVVWNDLVDIINEKNFMDNSIPKMKTVRRGSLSSPSYFFIFFRSHSFFFLFFFFI